MNYEPVPSAELGALVNADFEGLPRGALVASIHYLAEKLAEAQDVLAEAGG